MLDFVSNQILATARTEGEAGGLGRDVTLRKALEVALPFVETSSRTNRWSRHRAVTVGLSFPTWVKRRRPSSIFRPPALYAAPRAPTTPTP